MTVVSDLPQDTRPACSSPQTWLRLLKPISGNALSANPAAFVGPQRMMTSCSSVTTVTVAITCIAWIHQSLSPQKGAGVVICARSCSEREHQLLATRPEELQQSRNTLLLVLPYQHTIPIQNTKTQPTSNRMDTQIQEEVSVVFTVTKARPPGLY